MGVPERCRKLGVRQVPFDRLFPGRGAEGAPPRVYVFGDVDLRVLLERERERGGEGYGNQQERGGPLSLWENRQYFLSIVGTRRPSLQATEWLRGIFVQLSATGILGHLITISGFAYGIDKRAFDFSLRYGVPTIVVLPYLFPYQVKRFRAFKKVMVISEFGCSSEASIQHWHFVKRNRIIAMLGNITLVVQAPIGSGSLITASFADTYGREVFFRVSGALRDLGTRYFLATGRGKVAIDAYDIVAGLNDSLRDKFVLALVHFLKSRITSPRWPKDDVFVRGLVKTRLEIGSLFRRWNFPPNLAKKIMLELLNRNWAYMNGRAILLNLFNIFVDESSISRVTG